MQKLPLSLIKCERKGFWPASPFVCIHHELFMNNWMIRVICIISKSVFNGFWTTNHARNKFTSRKTGLDKVIIIISICAHDLKLLIKWFPHLHKALLFLSFLFIFYYFNRIKLWNAAPSGRKANIEPRTAQIWAKRLRKDPSWNIYEKQTNKVNRKPSQLQQEHKQHLL